MVEMELLGVRLELPANTPVLLLREQSSGRRVLPIYIGAEEARAIALALEGVRTPRPLTHDLFRDALDALGARLVRVSVTELHDSTFFAEMELESPAGTAKVSARPSDAVALAVRTETPIFVAEPVLDAAASPLEEDSAEGPEEDSEELVDQFRAFIDEISPEDFES